MGRAGRNGKQSWATILYRKGDANVWVLNNLSNKEKCTCDRILSGFLESWKYILYAHFSEICRCQMIVNLFGEEDTEPTSAR